MRSTIRDQGRADSGKGGWRTLVSNFGEIGAVAATAYYLYDGAAVGAAAAGGAKSMFWWDPEEFRTPGKALVVRLKIYAIASNVAPGVNFDGGLRPVTGIGGTNASAPITAAGARLIATNLLTPAANALTGPLFSPEIPAPAAQSLIMEATNSGIPAANSVTGVTVSLMGKDV